MVAGSNVARESLRRAREVFSPGLILAQRLAGSDSVEVGAKGVWVTRSDGVKVMDFGSYAVTLLGHGNDAILQAVRQQLERQPTSTRSLANPATVQAASELVDVVGDDKLRRVYFGLSGSDAVDTALKLARLSTGRQRIVALRGGFHGKALGPLAATENVRFRSGLEPSLAPVTHIEVAPESFSAACQHDDVAAIIFEPVQGEGGVRIPSRETLLAWREEARHRGVLFIADEVQTGLGRCGEVSVAVADGLDPDAVLFGKPLGGGVLPISATLGTEEFFSPLIAEPFKHTSTFSGHPLSCAAATATIQLLPYIIARARTIGAECERRLTDLASRFPGVVTDVRGRGLLWGLECSSPAVAGGFLSALLDRGLLVSPCISAPHVIRLLPPAVVELDELEQAFEILENSAREAMSYIPTASNGAS